MEKHDGAGAVCAACHAPLRPDGGCPACLLRGGLAAEETLPDEPPDVAAAVFGDFEIARREDGSLWELGRGAMGITYKAVDRVLHRPVALKVIQFSAAVAGDQRVAAALRERFLREARAAAALRHTNVAGVFHFGASDDAARCYYAMELIEGETLEARVRRDGPLDVKTAVEVVRQVAAALVAAAGRGLIHRDLKPGNLMLSGGGGLPAELEVKVIDFGLAKAAAGLGETDLTHGGFVGTPAYASPEQFEGGTVDARSDLYSLGVTLWYALTGRVPVRGKTFDELRHHPARADLPVEQLRERKVPAPVVTLLRAMLAVDPAERPASAKALMAALETCRRQLGAARDGERSALGERSPAPRAGLAVAVIAVVAIVAALAAGGMWWARSTRQPADSRIGAAPLAVEKSIAVLPFENRSVDPENAFFADGVQEEILIDLAKIADLKVISRTSTMRYRDAAKRDLPEIARALGVTHLVEGSVQRAGNQIRVTAQLIDARTDAHRWAERYDRPLDNIFALQSEIAQAIAGQLQARLSPQENTAITEAPTHDQRAYELYLQARASYHEGDGPGADDGHLILDTLEQATARDPGFVRAYVLMADVASYLYFNGEATPAMAAATRRYAETAARLRPGSPDASLAMGYYDYYIRRDYPRAREGFAAVVRQLPNDARAWASLGFVERRQGLGEESLGHLRRAMELDPENGLLITTYLDALKALGRYPEAQALLDHQLIMRPRQFWLRTERGRLWLEWKADTRAARAELAALPPGYDPVGKTTISRLWCEACDRDFSSAQRTLAACSLPEIWGLPRAVWEGDLARYRGDAPAAVKSYAAARPALESTVRSQPDDEFFLMSLASLDAALGNREAALAQGRRALTMSDRRGDAVAESPLKLRWVYVLTQLGEREQAIAALQPLVGRPYGPSYGALRLDPEFDALRGDPRFEAQVASLAPKP